MDPSIPPFFSFLSSLKVCCLLLFGQTKGKKGERKDVLLSQKKRGGKNVRDLLLLLLFEYLFSFLFLDFVSFFSSFVGVVKLKSRALSSSIVLRQKTLEEEDRRKKRPI